MSNRIASVCMCALLHVLLVSACTGFAAEPDNRGKPKMVVGMSAEALITLLAVPAPTEKPSAVPLPQKIFNPSVDNSVNMQVARSLDLHIKDADQLRDEIRSAP